MRRLEPEKLLTIITADELESMLIAAMTRRGIRGYTIVQAHGAGASGIQSGVLEGDTSSSSTSSFPGRGSSACSTISRC